MKYALSFALVVLAFAGTISCAGKQQPAVTTAPMVQGVKIETVAQQPLDQSYEAVGTVRAKTSSIVSSKVMGSIVAMRIREGDTVRAGQVLVEIDSREARIQTQKSGAGLVEMNGALDEVDRSIKAAESSQTAAEANRRLAASTLIRYRKLRERQSISPQEFDEVQARQEVADAEAERAERLLQSLVARRRMALARIDQAKADVSGSQVYSSFTRIVAPISGVVVSRQADVGYMATPGTPLLTIESGRDYRLEAGVQESQINQIHLRDQVRVQIDALGQQELAGTVVEIVPASDPASRTYLVKISIALPGGNQQIIRSGLYGKARFITGQTQAITIPRQALVERGQLISVFVVDQSGTARMRLVKTGKTYSDRVEVLSGLQEGEQIVVDGLAAVNDGSRVREAAPGLPATTK
ncbi:MAG TPA: efflux RND transporter periplasmic adaptor subunit [Pyrinomonadaceae bacterium]|nr:efflux RND transporter periplasmic adaptor subunit [Pyrinomonadaceae bacterium]